MVPLAFGRYDIHVKFLMIDAARNAHNDCFLPERWPARTSGHHVTRASSNERYVSYRGL